MRRRRQAAAARGRGNMSIDGYLAGRGVARFPFLFVVTYGRSGSTLLQGLLNAIDGYCIRGENKATLFHLYRASAATENARRFHRGAEDPTSPWYGADRLDTEKIARRWLDGFLDEIIQPPSGTRCCGFKEIRHLVTDMSDEEFAGYLRFVERGFPGAGFIFNVRSVEATGRSGWWPGFQSTRRTEILVHARLRMARQAEAMPNGLLFSYDAWQADTDYPRRLFEFLGEPYDAALVRRVKASRHSY